MSDGVDGCDGCGDVLLSTEICRTNNSPFRLLYMCTNLKYMGARNFFFFFNSFSMNLKPVCEKGIVFVRFLN